MPASGSLMMTLTTCTAESLQNPVTIVRYAQLVYYILIIFFGLPLNIFVILLVIISKKLHTLSFAVAMQVVVLNIFMVSILITTNIISLSANGWLFGEYVCEANGALNTMAYITRITLMLVSVIDRFMTVTMPFFYPKYRLRVVLTMSSMVWLLLGLNCIIILPELLDCYSNLSVGPHCVASTSCSNGFSIALNILNVLVTIPSIVLPTILYATLFRIAKKSQSGIVVPAHDNRSGAAFKSEWRATITSCLMFVAVFVLIMLLFIWNGIYTLISFLIQVPQWFEFVTLCLEEIFMLLVIIDPIFIMCNEDVSEAISEIMYPMPSQSSAIISPS